MALGGLAVLILHRKASRSLALTTEPGTLAAAVALGGASDMSHLLSGKDTEEEMRAMLADLQFTIDPVRFRPLGSLPTAKTSLHDSFLGNGSSCRTRGREGIFRVSQGLCPTELSKAARFCASDEHQWLWTQPPFQ